MGIRASFESSNGSRGASNRIKIDVHHHEVENFEVCVNRTTSSINFGCEEWVHTVHDPQAVGESRCSTVCHYLTPEQAREIARQLNEQADAFEADKEAALVG